MCMRVIAALAFLALVAVPSAVAVVTAADTVWRLEPGQGAGDITARSSEAQIIRRFGRRNVARVDVPIGNGQLEPGTIVFPKDPKRKIDILWKNRSVRVSPKYARITGDDSVWSIQPGIRLGTTLEELEAMNGAPLTLSGLGGSSGGTVLSWNRGALDRALGPLSRVAVRLAPPPALREAAEPFAGDTEFPSEALHELDLRVYEISVDFD
jgi:hypothetical protein